MIRVSNLVKRYGTTAAVDGVSFDVAPAEIFALLGPNGAGKTSIVKLLTTLTRPTEGVIEIGGVDAAVNPHEVRTHLGVVFQEATLDDDMTAYENMEFHATLHRMSRCRDRIEHLLRDAELWQRRDERVKRFSGGLRRRLEIARALLHVPEILVLDEATAGLDPQTRNHLWELIEQLSEEGMTVLMTTHYLEEAERVAHRVAVMDHGRIVALGGVEQLKQQTNSATLDQAFVTLTGTAMRD